MASKGTKKTATKATKKKASRRQKIAVASRGLSAAEVVGESPPPSVLEVMARVEALGGHGLGAFRDPLGGHWQVLASLPLDQVEPMPFQRDLSPAHVKRLAAVIDRLDWFIDPVIAVPTPAGHFRTPNGFHRLEALRRLGARSIVALVLLDADIAYQILALNTEKAHNVKEKSLEVIRMARFVADVATREGQTVCETDFAGQFEEPSFLTLGVCYERRPRFAGGAYRPVLERSDSFVSGAIAQALGERERRAERLLAIDDRVAAAVKDLQARGFESPFLKTFVIARVNPLRFERGGDVADFDGTLDKMEASLEKLDVDAVRADQVAAASSPAD